MVHSRICVRRHFDLCWIGRPRMICFTLQEILAIIVLILLILFLSTVAMYLITSPKGDRHA
jgi:hypothetical protein